MARVPALKRRVGLLALWGVAAMAGVGVLHLAWPASVIAAGAVKITVQTPSLVVQGEPFVITATLVDGGGRPVADVPVEFARQTLYGWLPLGKATTDARGTARLKVTERAVERIVLRAAFAGSDRFEAGEAAASPWVQEVAAHAPAAAPPYSLIGIEARTGMPVMGVLSTMPFVTLGLLVGGVWVTYAYVFALLAGVWRDGRRTREPGR